MDSVVVDYPNSLIDIQDIRDSIILWVANYEDGQELPSGIYFYKLSCHGSSLTRRMVLLK